MRRLLFLAGLMLMAQSLLLAQSPKQATLTNDGVIMINKDALSPVYTIDISQIAFEDKAHAERYLQPFNDESMTARLNMENQTVTLTLNVDDKPDWTLQMWQSLLKRKARPVSSVN